MTSLAEEGFSERRHAGWDAVVAVGLGMALLTAGWLDVRAFLAHRRDKPPSQFAFMDPSGGEHLGVDEMYRWRDAFVVLDNFDGPEVGPQGHFRQALGPTDTILILARQLHAALEIKLYNPLPGQDIVVSLNNQPVEQLLRQPEGVIVRNYPLTLRPGINVVTFTFARYNHAGATVNDADSRPLAGTFFKLGLTLY